MASIVYLNKSNVICEIDIISSINISFRQNPSNGNKKRETKWLPFFIIDSVKNLLNYDLFNFSKVLTNDSYKIDSTSVSR